MLCGSCGFTSSNDANFCSMCGVSLTPTAHRKSSLGTVLCRSCGQLNEDVAVFCRACGKKIPSSIVVGPTLFQSDLAPEDDYHDSQDCRESIDKFAQSRHESLLARLDRLERDIVSKLEDSRQPRENEPATWETKGDNLMTMSSTLDDLISDLIGAEINEYMKPDCIPPDATGFPTPHLSVVPKTEKSRGIDRRQMIVDTLVVLALVLAVFMVGMTAGIWGIYTLGF